ncbi:GNAT family N-acetyltransferase [Tenacibaculum aestuariivivum]|uniref:GNAT family N-acetyltransferase n=1 Tax=Tenacibaculum aestuariivivum TaxID=2006131 RepID=UPI003AB60F4D
MKIIPKRFSSLEIESRVNWINDKRINKTMFFNLPASVEDTKKWYLYNLNNNSRIDFSFFNEKGIIIAMGGFTGINNLHQNAEFYVMVNPDRQGMGIGKLVSLWMYNYAYSILKLNKIFLYTNDDNIAAYSIYQKAGFTLEGVLKNHKWKDGKFHNRRIYGLLKSEWDKLPWKEKIQNDV